MKKFAVLLTMIFVFAGSAEARISSSRTFAHFPTCTDGLVKKMCVCRSKVNPLGRLISFVRLDGIATPSMARVDSNGWIGQQSVRLSHSLCRPPVPAAVLFRYKLRH